MSILRTDPLSIEIPKRPPNKSASEHRRATKPIMEKRRRARINNSLNELKNLILEALNKDVSVSSILIHIPLLSTRKVHVLISSFLLSLSLFSLHDILN